MLRIAPSSKSPKPILPKEEEPLEEEVLEPEEPEDEEEEDEEEPPMKGKSMDDELDSYPSCQISQLTVHYQPPNLGPFRCDHCLHWMGDGQCRFVEGEIDPEGLCNIYEPVGLEEGPNEVAEPVSEEPLELDSAMMKE